MKLIIDIPDYDYRQIKEYYEKNDIVEATYSYIYHGTPLPKGHGRLGDLSKIYDRLNDAQIEGTVEYKGLGEAKQIICDAPTIIEADKESEG